MVFVIISAEIDLSVGSMMGLLALRRSLTSGSAGRAAHHSGDAGDGPAARRVERMVGSLSQGASFIVTLAGMLAFRGILIGITNGTTVSPTSPAMSQIGQSYLPDGIGFGIGVVGMAVFIVWQWRGRMRRQALGLATSSSTAAVGRRHYRGDCAGRNLAAQ